MFGQSNLNQINEITKLISDQAESHKIPEPEPESGIQKWKKLPQEIVNRISSYIWYKEEIFKTEETGEKLSTGLVALRLASRDMNRLVENTPDGQSAREAKYLEPNFISKRLAKIDYENKFGVPTTFTTLGGCITGGFCFMGIGVAQHASWISLLLCVPGWFAGSAGGWCMAGPVAEGGSWLVEQGLFKNKQYVKDCNKEVENARMNLKPESMEKQEKLKMS